MTQLHFQVMYYNAVYENENLNLIIHKHMSIGLEESELELAQIEQIEYTPAASSSWKNPDTMDLTPSILYSRFQAIETASDLCRTASLMPTFNNVNKVLQDTSNTPLSSGDIKMLCILAPWLYKLSDEIDQGYRQLVLEPLSAVNVATGEWMITTRRMIMLAAIVNWHNRCVHPNSKLI